VNIVSPRIQDVLLFLSRLYENKLSYMSINSARSALSTLLLPIDGVSIGEHPLVIRFMKGVWRLRTPAPKYAVTWDVNLVFELFRTWSASADLPLNMLAMKLAALIVLVTGQRVQTLSKIQVNNINVSQSVQIVITDKLKTTGIRMPNPVLKLPAYSLEPKLCVVEAIKCYLDKTKEIRTGDKLFIRSCKPYSAVCSQTIGKWLVKVLTEAGVNTRHFGAHSFRHASTSAAASKGICVDSILSCVGWSRNSSVFANYYNKPIDTSSSFAHAVMP
jgi:integrase